MTDLPRTSSALAEELGSLARPGPGKVGLEVEMALVRASDLTPAPYDGPAGVGALLQALHDDGFLPDPVYERGALIALSGEGGESITIEPGGQIELSTNVLPNVGALADVLPQRLSRVAALANQNGLLLLGGGISPIAQEDVPWMPKARYGIMREYFASLGAAGALAHRMMKRTLSVQVTLDFHDAADGAEKLRLALLSAPIATATFAASPIDGDQISELQSLRAEAWLATDPGRCGEMPACLLPGADLEAYADWVLDAPMMFRIRGKEHIAMHGASFRRVLEAGQWDDGTEVTADDLWNHLGSVFPEARLKKGVIELRSTDGQLPGEVRSIPAFWVGLLYDAQARREALDLLGGLPLGQPRAALNATVPREGLRARWGDALVLELAQALVESARGGLGRLVAAGREQASVIELLTPVRDRLAAGRSPSDEMLAAYAADWPSTRRAWIESLAFQP